MTLHRILLLEGIKLATGSGQKGIHRTVLV